MAKKSDKNSSTSQSENTEDLEHAFFEGGDPSSSEIDDSVIQSFRPKWRRNPYVALVVIPISIFLMYMLYADFSYGVRGLFSKEPKDIGEITKAMADGKLSANTYVTVKGTPFVQSIIPVPKKGKRGKKPTHFYLYYILQGTDNSVIVKLLSDKPQFVGEIPGRHTGRLMRLKDVSEGKRIQAYVKNDKNNRVDQDILFAAPPWTVADKHLESVFNKNLSALRSGAATFTTDMKRVVHPRPDFRIDVKAHFLPDVFVSFNRKKELFANITAVGGAYANDNCDKGIGGDVLLKKDDSTYVLPASGTITGESATSNTDKCDYAAIWSGKKSSDPKKIGFDPKKESATGAPIKPVVLPVKTIKIPSDAEVVDLDTGKRVEFKDGQLRIRGARAGELPAKKRLKITHNPFGRIEGCYNWLIQKGYPFAKLGTLGDLGDGNWELIARMPEADAAAIRAKSKIEKRCKKNLKGAGPPEICTFVYPSILVKPRDHFIYNVKYGDLKVQGDELLILNARANFPKKYSVALSTPPEGMRVASGKVKMLTEQKAEPTYRLPLLSLNKFKFYPKTEIPDDAWILVSDETPGKWRFIWKIPIVLVLFALMAFNIHTVSRHFFGKNAD